MGRSCGGPTTKMVDLVDALGHLVRFLLLPGQKPREERGRTTGQKGALLADKALDKDGLLRELPVRVAPAGIPSQANRKERRSWDREACKWRHLMENCLARVKEYRCMATRHDKTASSYAANWHLAATLLASG